MGKKYRLIWFQHLHKAAGSSIVQLAQDNNETLFPKHRNGNPVGDDDEWIRVWNMPVEELIRFVDNCEEMGVTFVATEFGRPDYQALANDPRVFLVTCLRDPVKRFISNYYYAFYRGTTDCKTPYEYVNSYATFTMPEYYCRTFSRLGSSDEPVTREHYDKALAALNNFDCVVLLEKENPFQELLCRLGWSNKLIHANLTKMPLINALKYILRGKAHLLLRRITNPRKNDDPQFKRFFEDLNEFDLKLYKHFIAND
jgi:hypothetical protein